MKKGEGKSNSSKPRVIDLNLHVGSLLDRSLLLNPVVIASAVWGSVISLYSMHLSSNPDLLE
jgi:hypothetical protein